MHIIETLLVYPHTRQKSNKKGARCTLALLFGVLTQVGHMAQNVADYPQPPSILTKNYNYFTYMYLKHGHFLKYIKVSGISVNICVNVESDLFMFVMICFELFEKIESF